MRMRSQGMFRRRNSVIDLPLFLALIYPLSFVDRFNEITNIYSSNLGFITGVLIASVYMVYSLISYEYRIKLDKYIFILLYMVLFIFIRIAISGDSLKLIVTFIGNIFVTISIIHILYDYRRLLIFLVSFIFVSLIVSIYQIYIYWTSYSFISSSVILSSGVMRIQGLMRDPNYACMFMVSGFIFLFSIYICIKNSITIKFIILFFLSILLYGIFLTYSRAGLLSVVISSIMLLTSFKRRINIVYPAILLICLYILFIYILPENISSAIINRFDPDFIFIDPSNTARLSVYENGIRSILGSYSLYVGLGSSDAQYHNTFIDIISYGGILLFIPYLYIIISLFVRNHKIYEKVHSHQSWISIGSYCSLAGFVIIAATIGAEFEKITWTLFAIGISAIRIGASKAPRVWREYQLK